jgi:hypothetical protein
MKKLLGLVMYAAVMFGVTAGLGMFMLKKSASQGVGTKTAEAGESAADVEADSSSAAGHQVRSAGHAAAATPHAGGAALDVAQGTSSVHGRSRSDSSDERLPVAVRATPMSVEEIVRMGLSLKARSEVVKKREDALREAEAQQRLVLSDIASAQQEIENLLAQASDQRAAKEELLARITAQNEAQALERKAMSDERKQLLADQEKLDADRKKLEAEKTALVQSQNELQLKRKELDADKQLFANDRTRVTLDGEKLVKDREVWLVEQQKIASDRQQLEDDRRKLKNDRDLLEQEQRAFASISGRPVPGSTSEATVPDEASRQKNLKSTVQLFESRSPEQAAGTLKELVTRGNSELVVDALLAMDQRKAGAIMDALEDEKLVTDLVLLIDGRNSAPKKAAKKP